MCNCKNIKMGSYSNITTLVYPEWFDSKHFIRTADIDNCLVDEIKDLWSKGIQTTACCCGHNTAPSVISIIPEDIEKMDKLGYKNFCNWKFKEARTHFKPKTKGVI